ncbi:MAG: DUF6798 domain-containing protein [Chitinophagales bacterium]|nr:hypothetical protein [Chitinophagales bacterium]MDW8273594.1 DUF6798 domain-containing protein [Chitinophagales bacterium]
MQNRLFRIVPSKRYTLLIFSVILFLILTLQHGYEFGYNDQVELLPYAFFLKHREYYKSDFFIQSLHATLPNERIIMALLLQPFIDQIDSWNIVFHFITSLVLIIGLAATAHVLIGNLGWAIIAVSVSLIRYYDYGIGNNEVWTPSFQASNLACALLSWVFYYILKHKINKAFMLLIAASLVHPLEGLHVFIGSAFFILGHTVKDFSEINIKKVLWPLIYTATAGVYMTAIYLAKQKNNHVISSEELFDILFNFRHAHHFIFSSFIPQKIVFTFLCVPLAVVAFYRRHRFIGRWVETSFGILIAYIFFVEFFNSPTVASFQAYKSAQWIKFFGIVAVTKFLKEIISLLTNKSFEKTIQIVLCVYLLHFATKEFWAGKKTFDDILYKNNKAMINICEQIKRYTPLDAVFIQPFETTELKWYARRSSYVEFKANPRHKGFVAEWYNRIREVYGIHTGCRIKGFELRDKANTYFLELTTTQLQKLKTKGVTHLLTFRNFKAKGLKLIIANEKYAVYQL